MHNKIIHLQVVSSTNNVFKFLQNYQQSYWNLNFNLFKTQTRSDFLFETTLKVESRIIFSTTYRRTRQNLTSSESKNIFENVIDSRALSRRCSSSSFGLYGVHDNTLRAYSVVSDVARRTAALWTNFWGRTRSQQSSSLL